MWKEFRAFLVRGNVIDLTVAVVIGASFTTIVSSLVQDIINPLVGLLSSLGTLTSLTSVAGSQDFSNYFLPLSPAVTANDYTTAKTQGAVLGYGAFATSVINFLLVSAPMYLVVKLANRLQQQKKEEDAPKAPELSKDQQLLTEIRDILQGTPGSRAVAPESSASENNAQASN